MDEQFDAFEPTPPEQPTRQLPHSHDDLTRHIGYAGPPPVGPPPQTWRVPPWRRRGPLIGAGLVVLMVAGLVVGILLSAPSSTPAPTNAAATAPTAVGGPTPAAGKEHRKARGGRARAPRVRATGTVTDVDGGTATLVEADGRTVALDLSGIGHPPANGDVVVVTGSVTDGGRTVQVSKVVPVTVHG